MTLEELEPIIENLRELMRINKSGISAEYENFVEKYPELPDLLSDDYDNSKQIDFFIEWIEINIDTFEDVEDVKELFEIFKEEDESWKKNDFMFPNGRDDD